MLSAVSWAACLAYFGNPANMAFCIACFIRDTAGALGMHSTEKTVQYARPEIIRARAGSIYHLGGDKRVPFYGGIISDGPLCASE